MDSYYLVENLSEFGFSCPEDSDDFVNKANALCSMFHLSDEDFVDEVIAYANNQRRTVVDETLLESLEQDMAKKLKKNLENVTKSASKPKRTVLGDCTAQHVIADDEMDTSCYTESVLESGVLNGKYAAFAPVRNTPSNAKYQSRLDSGKIVSSYTGDLFVPGAPKATLSAVTVDVISPEVNKQYTDDKISCIINDKYDRMAEFAQWVREANPDIELTTLIEPSTDEICVYGEVLRDVESNEFCLQLDNESASCIRLDLTGCPEYSLFPGQLTAFRGTGESEGVFAARAQLWPSSIRPSNTPNNTVDGNLRIWCACGPFCGSDDAAYEPLCDLLDGVRREQPHALILMGPFVDRKNKWINSENCQNTLHEVMEQLLMRIGKALESCSTEVILQPSGIRDGIQHGVFPCAPFAVSPSVSKFFGKRLHIVSDPCVVRIAGVEVAMTNSEVMAHLSKVECYRSQPHEQENKDRILRLARHILWQRSMYPVQPAMLPSSLAEILRCARIEQSPHILITPSLLPPTVKAIDTTMYCNPGHLYRGTYVKTEITRSSTLTDSCEWHVVRI